jgi:hypothetical protein
MAIFGQSGLQVLHTRQERDDLLAEALILGFEVGNPLVQSHASNLHLYRTSA